MLASPTEAKMTSVLTSADNGKTVDLRVGDEATLSLPENPSTGYRWAVDATDPNLVDLRQGNYVSASNAMGGGGEVEWLIKAKAPGSAEVKLKRWRPWEGDRSIVERYAIRLRISP
jgi:inhibitor of cysteine peptidase